MSANVCQLQVCRIYNATLAGLQPESRTDNCQVYGTVYRLYNKFLKRLSLLMAYTISYDTSGNSIQVSENPTCRY